MSKNDHRLPHLRPSSAPPEATQLDASWDDETVPGSDLDDPLNEFDRVTAIPEIPELYAQRVQQTAVDSRVPRPGTAPPTAPPPNAFVPRPEEYFTLESGPPPTAQSADSTARYAALSSHDALTARPAAPAPVATPTRSPGVPPHSPSLTGLELADFDSISPLKAVSRQNVSKHDPRDPVLELSFEDPEPVARFKEPESGALGNMKDRYAMGDFSGALVIAEGILESNPEDLEVPRYAQSCRDVLTQMYSARLGSLDQVVSIALPSDQIRWLTLDHRAGFLLSLIDGGSTLDQILDISGMTRLDALRIMYQLLDQRVILLGG